MSAPAPCRSRHAPPLCHFPRLGDERLALRREFLEGLVLVGDPF